MRQQGHERPERWRRPPAGGCLELSFFVIIDVFSYSNNADYALIVFRYEVMRPSALLYTFTY